MSDLKNNISGIGKLQLDALTDDLIDWLKNPYKKNEEKPNNKYSFIVDGKIDPDFFKGDQCLPFIEKMQKNLLTALMANCEEPEKAKENYLLSEIKKIKDNMKLKDKIFQQACKLSFEISLDEISERSDRRETEEQYQNRVIKPMQDLISASPEKEEIASEEQYKELREKVEKILDLSNVEDRVLAPGERPNWMIKEEKRKQISEQIKIKPKNKKTSSEKHEQHVEEDEEHEIVPAKIVNRR